jgi:uncharacterized protein
VQKTPAQVSDFLKAKNIAIAGVSRDSHQPANCIYRKLKSAGYEVSAINPNASEVEGDVCYRDLHSVPIPIDAVMVATHPNATPQVARECADLGIKKVWLHRSFGEGSVSPEAIQVCKESGVDFIVGGCPMMYCEPVDFGHRCMRWMLKLTHKLPE